MRLKVLIPCLSAAKRRPLYSLEAASDDTADNTFGLRLQGI